MKLNGDIQKNIPTIVGQFIWISKKALTQIWPPVP